MGQQCLVDLHPGMANVIGSAAKIESVPVCNGCDEQVKARCSVLLVLEGTVRKASLAIGVNCISQSVPGLSLVQTGLAGAAQFWLFQPVECEQRPLDATEFAKGEVELVLPTIGGKLAQND